MLKAVFVHSFLVEEFVEEVKVRLGEGWDLNSGFVTGGNEIGQWMVEEKALYEYQVIIANSADGLNAITGEYIASGWDFYMPTAFG